MGEPIRFATPATSAPALQPFTPAGAAAAASPAAAHAPPSPGAGTPVLLPPLPPSAPAAPLPALPPPTALVDMHAAIARASRSAIMINGFTPAGPGNPQPTVSTGAGTVIEPGFARTSYHVVEGASAIAYASLDDRDMPVMKMARLVGADKRLDIALLQLEDQVIPPAEKAPRALERGDQVGIFGAPVNYQRTSSLGFITNTHVPVHAGPVCDCALTNAGINAGDSGSGVFDNRGRDVGMAEAFYADRQVMGFIIPTAEIDAVTARLHQGDLDPKDFGLTLADVDMGWAIDQHTRVLDGAIVTGFYNNAASAPFQVNDRLVAINGKRIANAAVALTTLELIPEGTKLRFVVDRKGTMMTIDAVR